MSGKGLVSDSKGPLKDLVLVDRETGKHQNYGAIAASKVTFSFKLWLTYRETDQVWSIVARGDFEDDGRTLVHTAGWFLARREDCWREWTALASDAAVRGLFDEAASRPS